MKAGLFLIYVLLLTQLSVIAQQQPAGYWMQHFTDENGLPQNSVKALAQDRNGFIWLTTEAGLVRFDGHRFITFEKSVVPISSNRMRGFVTAVNMGPRHGLPEFYALSEKNEYIGILENGLVWVDTLFYGAYKKRNPLASSRIRHHIILGSLPSQYEVNLSQEHYFASSESGGHYIFQKDEISYFRNGRRVFRADGRYRQFFLIGPQPFAVDGNGDFWAISALSRPVTIDGDIMDNSLYSPKKDRPRLFWNNISRQAFLYLNECLYSVRPSVNGSLSTRLVLEGLDFENLDIIAVLFDQTTGSLFLGSRTKGLYMFKKQGFQVQKLNAANADNVYYAQVPGKGQSVLTSQGYLFSAKSDKLSTTGTRLVPFPMNGISKFSMATRHDGTFWYQLGFDLYKMDRVTGKVLVHVKLAEQAKTMLVEPDGRLWIGCETNSIYTIDPTDKHYTPRRRFKLPVEKLTIIGKENDETMLIATETSFHKLNISSRVFTTVKNFDNMTVRSGYTTPEGIWITTYGNGFYLLNQNKVVKFPLDTDRYLATAHCIIEDKKGFFWITTNHGLFQVAKQQLLDFAAGKIRQVFYLYYDKRNGFATNEFNGGCYPCAVTLADGTVSLPSMDGLVWYKPDLIKPELPNRGIFISAIQQDGRNLKVTDTLEIPRDFEQLHLTVSTPYLGDEKNIHMHYSLTGPGRDQHWTSVNPDFIVSIPNLSHGDYQLRIRKASGFTANDYTYKTVQLHVPRAWYDTWWFRLLASIAFGGVFFASVRWRSAQHIKKEREANLVRHYRVISQIIAAVNHDIQTPLHYIGFSLKQFNEFVHKLSGIDPLIIRMSDETLGTSQRLNTLTKNILDYIKLQSKSPSERRHMTSVDVSGLVSDVKELFSGIAIHRQVSIINDIDATFNAYTDPSLLSIIIHNLIDNALKVSRSQIRVSSRITSGRKVVCIEDDGGGMPQEQVYWLNKKYRSYQEWLHASQNPGQKGIGLVIAKDLCVLLGIEIGVNVADGRTVILLSFPIS